MAIKIYENVITLSDSMLPEHVLLALKTNNVDYSMPIYSIGIGDNTDIILYPEYKQMDAPESIQGLICIMNEYKCNVIRVKYNGSCISFNDRKGITYNSPPRIDRMMTISANNISEPSRQYLNKIVKIGKSELVRPKSNQGWFITKQMANDDNFDKDYTPKDILACVQMAEKENCSMLCIEANTKK